MSDSGHPEDEMSDAERDAVLAAEHALGILDGEDRARAEQRMAEDRAFAAEVERWHQRLGEWLADVPPEQPPERVWTELEQATRTRQGVNDKAGGSWLDRLWFWRAATAGALAAAAVLAVVVVRPEPQAEMEAAADATTTEAAAAPEIRRAAVLNGENGQPAFVALLEREEVVVTALSPFDLAEDRALELWLVPADGVPRSLGLIQAAQSTSIVVPEALRPHAGTAQALAVSLEPPGGAPGGVATGPLVAQGALSTS